MNNGNKKNPTLTTLTTESSSNKDNMIARMQALLDEADALAKAARKKIKDEMELVDKDLKEVKEARERGTDLQRDVSSGVREMPASGLRSGIKFSSGPKVEQKAPVQSTINTASSSESSSTAPPSTSTAPESSETVYSPPRL